ncbi:MAG: DUF937 domain-containing protein [Bacteroidota bacterium]
MDLMDLLKSQIGEQAIGAMTSQLGGASPKATSAGMDGAMSILMGALAKNTKNEQGASALNSALDRDHDGSILDDVVGFLNGTSQATNTRAANGAGILGHLLGGQQGQAVEQLSKASGLDQQQASSMLMKMAPLVLGMLGKQKRNTNMGLNDLSGLLAGAAQTSRARVQGGDLLTSFLDQDGDGSIVDDAAKIGGSFLKNIFRRRR